MPVDTRHPAARPAPPLSRSRIGALARVLDRWKATIASLASFGGVGAIAFVVDVGVYNLLRATVLEDSPIWSKVASVAVATVVAWIGNRFLTFRDSRSGNVVREAALFAVMNVGGLLIAAACLFVSHYVLGFTSQLADNIAGNVVGLVLGTAFRYVGYRFVVFRPARTSTTSTDPAEPTDPIEPSRSTQPSGPSQPSSATPLPRTSARHSPAAARSHASLTPHTGGTR